MADNSQQTDTSTDVDADDKNQVFVHLSLLIRSVFFFLFLNVMICFFFFFFIWFATIGIFFVWVLNGGSAWELRNRTLCTCIVFRVILLLDFVE